MWANPRRFRRVCPLLVETPNGLRCSVDAPDVRPFWGRTFGFVGGALGSVYLLGTLALFVAFRGVGYPVSYFSVAWPPAWSQINDARGEYFLRKGVAALTANNIKEALFSLSTAYDLAPRNYDTGLALASLRQMTHPGYSDRLYSRLLVQHPEQNDRTANAWHRALLARGDYPQIKALASEQLARTHPNHLGYWMQTLLFAIRRTHDQGYLRQMLETHAGLEAQWRKIFTTELLVQSGQREQAATRLSQIWPEATHPFVSFYQANTLVEIGEAQAALRLIENYGSRIRDNERYRVRLDAFAALKQHSLRASDIDRLLGLRPTGPVLELLGAHLVRYPDRTLLAHVTARLEEAPLALTKENHNAYAALFCAAGVSGDFDRLKTVSLALRKINGASSVVLDGFEAFFQDRSAQKRVEVLLPSVPLPLELTYALLARYPTVRPSVAPTKRP